jgi:hypothetical protein
MEKRTAQPDLRRDCHTIPDFLNRQPFGRLTEAVICAE